MDSFVPEKNLKRSEYLYGVPGIYFSDLKYNDALTEKISLAKSVVAQLIETKGLIGCDTQRLNDCLNSVKFNESLLKEAKGQI